MGSIPIGVTSVKTTKSSQQPSLGWVVAFNGGGIRAGPRSVEKKGQNKGPGWPAGTKVSMWQSLHGELEDWFKRWQGR